MWLWICYGCYSHCKANLPCIPQHDHPGQTSHNLVPTACMKPAAVGSSTRNTTPYPDPWADVAGRSPLRVPRPKSSIGYHIKGSLLFRSSQGSGYIAGTSAKFYQQSLQPGGIPPMRERHQNETIADCKMVVPNRDSLA